MNIFILLNTITMISNINNLGRPHKIIHNLNKNNFLTKEARKSYLVSFCSYWLDKCSDNHINRFYSRPRGLLGREACGIGTFLPLVVIRPWESHSTISIISPLKREIISQPNHHYLLNPFWYYYILVSTHNSRPYQSLSLFISAPAIELKIRLD